MNFNIKLRNLLLRFTDIVTDKGNLTIDGELKVGATVYIEDDLALDGEYITEKEIIKVENGIITEIEVKEIKEDEPVVIIEEPVKEPVKEEPVELLEKIAELEAIIEQDKITIDELTAKLAEAEEKLLLSVEKLAKQVKVEEKKSIYSFKKN